MIGQEVIDFIGLNRAKSVNSENEKLSESEFSVLSEIKEKEFEIDSVYFNVDDSGNSYPAVFLKKVLSFDEKVLRKITEIHRKTWNYKKVLLLYVYSDVEIRIYNCSERPLLLTRENFNYAAELKHIEVETYSFSDEERIKELNMLFSRIAVDSGIIWTSKKATSVREKIDLRRRVDKYLVSSLVNTAHELQDSGLEINLIHKIILRSLFLLYLEDRGATDEFFYSRIKKGAKSYFDILEDVKATYDLYQKLEEHFNGNVFAVTEDENISVEQLYKIKKCFINGNDKTHQEELFKDWRLFDFSIIQIELLSEIYEKFLSLTDSKLQKESGIYYTTPSLVDFILNEKLPISKKETNYNVKILDPSCGSGIFLVKSFKRLVKRYENKHKKKLTDFETLKKLLTDNIFGIEIHSQAIKVATFSLYLALVDNLDPKTLWQNKGYCFPNLINNPCDSTLKAQGHNLFCRDTISNLTVEKELTDFQLIIGNPPFGKILTEAKDEKKEHKNIRDYCDTNKFPKEMVLPFLHKAVSLAPNGEIALIFNTKVLTNTSKKYQKFRKWLFKDCYVEKIFNFSVLRQINKDLGGQLFDGATGPISIAFYQNKAPSNPSDVIVYYAPKTSIKTNLIEGLSIDYADVKFLPRKECQKLETKIWKIAMWGNYEDWRLINLLCKKHSSFKTYLTANKIQYGSGLHPKEQGGSKIHIEGKHIETQAIDRYYTSANKTNSINKEFRNNNLKLFKHPLAVIKEGITNSNIRSCYFDYDVYYNKAVYGFSTSDTAKSKAIAIIFNSKLANYFFFLTASSWGIERDRIVLAEYLNFPYLELNLKEVEKIQFSSINFNNEDSLFNKKKTCFDSQYWESQISKLYNLSSKEITRISDTISLSFDLFHNKDKSVALYSVKQPYDYAKIISEELNHFVNSQNVFVNATVYRINQSTPLMMIKLSFADEKKGILNSQESINKELSKMDKYLWEKNATNIYFRKRLNYQRGNDIYIIRPNQRRFWSKSIAIDDASELILEILNKD